MTNKDKMTLIIFITLIVLIFGIGFYNGYKNKKKENVDRKVEYLFDNLTYDMVYTNGCELFAQGIDLLINEKVFEYEKNYDGKYMYFSVDDYNHAKKIQNFMVLTNTLTNEEVTKYMNDKGIIKYENNYYLESNIDYTYNEQYIGSIIEINKYNEDYVYFDSTNYYCDSVVNYVGLLEDKPSCNYNTTKTTITIKLENNNLRLNNLEDLKSIVK